MSQPSQQQQLQNQATDARRSDNLSSQNTDLSQQRVNPQKMAELAKQQKKATPTFSNAQAQIRNSVNGVNGESADNESPSLESEPIQIPQNFYTDWQDKLQISPLLQINPDQWKNIAFPVINAVQLLINAQVSTFQKVFDIQNQQDDHKRRVSVLLKRMEKDMSKKEEHFDQQMDRLEKNMTSAFNKFRVDCENLIQNSEIRVEEGYTSLRSTLAEFKDKLSRVEETPVVKQWVIGFVDTKTMDLSSRIERYNSIYKDTNEQLIQTHLTVPGLIGSKYQFPTLSQYIKSSHDKQHTLFTTLEESIHKTSKAVRNCEIHMDTQFNDKLPAQLKTLTDKTAQQQEQHKQLEKKTVQEAIPQHQKLLEELQQDMEKQRIDHKVKIELQNNQIQQALYELDRLTMQMKYNKDEIDKKKEESFSYTQEIGKQIKDSVVSLQKALEFQKVDVNDKVRSLHNLIDRSEKRLKGTLEQITGQTVHIPTESDNEEDAQEQEQQPASRVQSNMKMMNSTHISQNLQKVEEEEDNRQYFEDEAEENLEGVHQQQIDEQQQLLNDQSNFEEIKQEDSFFSQQQLQQQREEGVQEKEPSQHYESFASKKLQSQSHKEQSIPKLQDNVQLANQLSSIGQVEGGTIVSTDQVTSKDIKNKSSMSIKQTSNYKIPSNDTRDQLVQDSVSQGTLDMPLNNATQVTFKPQLSFKKKESSKLSQSPRLTVEERLGNVELMFVECKNLIQELMSVLKIQKTPSLEKLAYLIQQNQGGDSQFKQYPQSDMNLGRLVGKGNSALGMQNMKGGQPPAIKLQSFENYFKKIISSGAAKNIYDSTDHQNVSSDQILMNNSNSNIIQTNKVKFQTQKTVKEQSQDRTNGNSLINNELGNHVSTFKQQKQAKQQQRKQSSPKNIIDPEVVEAAQQMTLNDVSKNESNMILPQNNQDRLSQTLQAKPHGNEESSNILDQSTSQIMDQYQTVNIESPKGKPDLNTITEVSRSRGGTGFQQKRRSNSSLSGGNQQEVSKFVEKLPPIVSQSPRDINTERLLQQQQKIQKIQKQVREPMPEIKTPKPKPLAVKYEDIKDIDKVSPIASKGKKNTMII